MRKVVLTFSVGARGVKVTLGTISRGINTL